MNNGIITNDAWIHLALKDSPMNERQLKAEITSLKDQIRALENTIAQMKAERAIPAPKPISLWKRWTKL